MDFRIVCHRFMKTKLDPIFDRRLNYYQPKQKGSNMRSIFPGIILFSIIGQMCRRWEKWCMWCSRNQPLNPKTQSPTFLGTMNSGVISDQLICSNYIGKVNKMELQEVCWKIWPSAMLTNMSWDRILLIQGVHKKPRRGRGRSRCSNLMLPTT